MAFANSANSLSLSDDGYRRRLRDFRKALGSSGLLIRAAHLPEESRLAPEI
jgi:hypothetical protein